MSKKISYGVHNRYLQEIAALCEKIETLLVGIKPGNTSNRAECDLPLTPHIVFRQAYPDGGGKDFRYYVHSSDKEGNKLLIRQCKKSKHYYNFSNYGYSDLKPITIFNKKIVEIDTQMFRVYVGLQRSEDKPEEFKSYAEAKSVILERLSEIRREATLTGLYFRC